MSRGTYQIRKPRKSDVTGILTLLRHCLGPSDLPRDSEYWQWKHQENPFGPSRILVAQSQGSIVGVRVFMPFKLQVGNQCLQGARPVDTATHPEWRRQGIFAELTDRLIEELQKDGFSLVFNTPNDQSLPANLSLGWSQVGRIRFAVRLVHPVRVLYGRIRSDNEKAHEGRRSHRLHVLKDGKEAQTEIAPCREFLRKSGGCCFIERSAIASMEKLSVPLSLKYLEWRYVDIPKIKYYAAWQDRDDSKGGIIFRITHSQGLKGIRICEVLANRSWEKSRAVRNVIDGVIGTVDPDYVMLSSSGIGASQMLVGLRFVSVPSSGRVLVARDIGENAVEDEIGAYSVDSWYLPLGCLEMI